MKLVSILLVGILLLLGTGRGEKGAGLTGEGKEGKRLIEFGPGLRVWLSQEQIDEIELERHKMGVLGTGYFDVTDFQEPVSSPFAPFFKNFPSSPAFQTVVNPLLEKISTENVRSYVQTLSDFPNRYYTTPSGVESAEWLRDLMQEMADREGRSDVNCSLFRHPTFPQGSVVCNIPGQEIPDEIVITGAHLDSVNSRNVPNGRAPGADDDASGVASFVEAFRVLLSSGFRPKRSIEFMAYAAEEVGLRGSQELARNYKATGKKVYAVYQNEMSGYAGRTPSIVVLQDFVDPNLTQFVERCAGEYTSVMVEKGMCGYGCSDHASWNREGFPAVCTAEAGPFGDVNPYMHTDQDTLDKMDLQLMTEFAKLSLAFVVELSLA